ncbi:amidohydrolase [bacterium]|nr:amidohydrolase [bacterium]
MPDAHEALKDLRRQLHAYPELSGQEVGTATCLREFLLPCQPTRLLERIGGHGLAVVFAAPNGAPGPTVVLRAELDALPITETATPPHASRNPGVGHLCGHDGHMAALCGVALRRRERPLVRGRLVLLFQPAEETGQGARQVAEDPRWQDLAVDHCYAIHNLPGYPLGQVLVREGPFTAGSVGLIVRLQGRTAHAAYPEQGLSPALAMSRLVTGLVQMPTTVATESDLALVTIVHAQLGDVAFGTSPGRAEIMATVRADREETLTALRERAAAIAREEAARDGLACELEWVEEFPVTANDDLAVTVVRSAAGARGLACAEPDESPFRWSEDFGWLIRDCTGALIGLGSGVDQPVLHAPDFDFPDELIPLAGQLYDGILTELGLLPPT